MSRCPDFGPLVLVSLGTIYTLAWAFLEIRHRRNMEEIWRDHAQWCVDFAERVLNDNTQEHLPGDKAGSGGSDGCQEDSP